VARIYEMRKSEFAKQEKSRVLKKHSRPVKPKSPKSPGKPKSSRSKKKGGGDGE
jgi:hypothetical protein